MGVKKMEWKDMLNGEDVPTDGIVAISVQDNILDKENYPVHGLFFRSGIVAEQFRMDEGRDVAYGLPDMLGKSVYDLVNWVNQNEDNDESYFPQTWHVAAKL